MDGYIVYLSTPLDACHIMDPRFLSSLSPLLHSQRQVDAELQHEGVRRRSETERKAVGEKNVKGLKEEENELQKRRKKDGGYRQR